MPIKVFRKIHDKNTLRYYLCYSRFDAAESHVYRGIRRLSPWDAPHEQFFIRGARYFLRVNSSLSRRNCIPSNVSVMLARDRYYRPSSLRRRKPPIIETLGDRDLRNTVSVKRRTKLRNVEVWDYARGTHFPSHFVALTAEISNARLGRLSFAELRRERGAHLWLEGAVRARRGKGEALWGSRYRAHCLFPASWKRQIAPYVRTVVPPAAPSAADHCALVFARARWSLCVASVLSRVQRTATHTERRYTYNIISRPARDSKWIAKALNDVADFILHAALYRSDWLA